MNLERPIAEDPYAKLPTLPGLRVSSQSFQDGSALGDDHAFTGGNISPELSWEAGPSGTTGYLISCFDPDAPTPSGFWHWVMINVPAAVTSLPAGAGAADGSGVPDGAVQLNNDFGLPGYIGSAPPAGDRPHRYIFAVTALSGDPIEVDAQTPAAKAHFFALGSSLARGTCTGTYQA